MKKLGLLLIFIIGFINVNAQLQDKYLIKFTDKNNSPFSLSNPQQFLSARAILRRTTQNIALTDNDLPVNTAYLSNISSVGAQIINKSKWFNSAIVTINNPANVSIIEALTFVNSVTRIIGDNLLTQPLPDKQLPELKNSSNRTIVELGYGGGFDQINQLNGIPLHNIGFTGKGIYIAVLDAGFNGYSTLPVFDSLLLQNRILGTYDFVTNETNVEGDDSHGTNVLSTMAANVPDVFIGTAPHASYYLLRTEDAPTEYLVEEYNWAAGAEFADSAGCDIINSSLGYTEFDAASQNHVRADLNGNTTPVTQAANIAASKGILVCNSAGNSGNDPWFYVGAPADGDKVFSIGAVDINGTVAGFSSRGPNSANLLKPNVSALGSGAFVAYSSGGYGTANGTSFSCPILAGMSACLLQSSPLSTNFQLMDVIQKSSTKALNPDFEVGYGIPNFNNAMLTLGVDIMTDVEKEKISFYPNPAKTSNSMKFFAKQTGLYVLTVIDLNGKLINKKSISINNPGVQTLQDFINPLQIVNGLYFLQLQTQTETMVTKFSVLN